jgi:hypothetical protein
LQWLNLSCGRAKWWMHWRGYVWLSERSPYASEQRCAMQTASGRRIVHGIECINLMQMLGNAAQHINIHIVLCDIYKLTWNICPRFMILLKMIWRLPEILLMRDDLTSVLTLWHGFGGLDKGMIPMVHECRNVCRMTLPDSILWLTNHSLLR